MRKATYPPKLPASIKRAAQRLAKEDRLSTADLQMLKRRAAEEGLGYQSLIASILHKFATGRSNRPA